MSLPGRKILYPLVVEKESGQHVEILRDVGRGCEAGAGEKQPQDVPDTPDIRTGKD